MSIAFLKMSRAILCVALWVSIAGSTPARCGESKIVSAVLHAVPLLDPICNSDSMVHAKVACCEMVQLLFLSFFLFPPQLDS